MIKLKKISLVLLCTSTLLLLTQQVSFSGDLEDFEKEASKKKSDKDSDKDSSKDDDKKGEGRRSSKNRGSSAFDATIFMEACFFLGLGVAYGGSNSIDRVSTKKGINNGYKSIKKREYGEFLIPFSRYDGSYQLVNTGIRAQDHSIQLGYSLFGGQFRFTDFTENDSDYSLKFYQLNFFYRMSFGDFFECDLGLGWLNMKGKDSTTGMTFSIPIIFHPHKAFSIEFRPQWAFMPESVITEMDTSLRMGWRYASIKAGYRYMQTGNQALKGPYLGFTAAF